MRRFAAHLAAIGLSLIALVGMLFLPAMDSFSLPSLFTFAWLSLAVLALLAQMRQANLMRSTRRVSGQKKAAVAPKRGV